MKTKKEMPERVCPLCGERYTDYPAYSRNEDMLEICPKCGTREALAGMGLDKEEIEKIVSLAYTK